MKNKVNEILTANGLDFRIEKAPMFAMNLKGEQVPSPYYGLINTKSNEVINTVKEGYTVSQNDEIVELVLRGMEPFGNALTVQKAGSLNGGRKVFMQLAIEGASIVAHDTIKRYVTIIDSNDGSTSLSIGIGDLTMSCSNQFAKFYAKGEAKFRHSASLTEKLKGIPQLIELALKESLKQIEVYNRFASTPVSKALAHELVKALLGFDRLISMDEMSKKSAQSINKMDKLYSHIDREMLDKGQNVWGLHSGVTSFTTHEISVPKRDNARMESVLIGGAYKMNQASLKFAERKSGLLELV
jgi:phage/plasmid-like protein (TIGR03299 family)